MGKHPATLRRITGSATTARSRAGAGYIDTRRRAAAASAALAGRHPSRMPMVVAVAAGLLGGAVAAVGAGRLRRRLPPDVQRRIAVAEARIRGDRVGALIESTRGSRRVSPHSSAMNAAYTGLVTDPAVAREHGGR